MFEPILEHNREEFDRLERKQLRFLFGLLVGIFPLTLLIILFAVDYADTVALSYLGILGAVLGVFEIRKTIVFRRDLVQQRDLE